MAPPTGLVLLRKIRFVLETAGLYLSRPPRRKDILSIYVGIRPLVKSLGTTKPRPSPEITIHIDDSGLLTIVGGKWTTYIEPLQDLMRCTFWPYLTLICLFLSQINLNKQGFDAAVGR
jgi:hypothetical protein